MMRNTTLFGPLLGWHAAIVVVALSGTAAHAKVPPSGETDDDARG